MKSGNEEESKEESFKLSNADQELLKWFGDLDMARSDVVDILADLHKLRIFNSSIIRKRDLMFVREVDMECFVDNPSPVKRKFYLDWKRDFEGLLEVEMRKVLDKFPAWAEKLCRLYPKLADFREGSIERIEECIKPATPQQQKAMTDLWHTEERWKMRRKGLKPADISKLKDLGCEDLESLSRMPREEVKNLSKAVQTLHEQESLDFQKQRERNKADIQEQRKRKEAGMEATSGRLQDRMEQTDKVGNVGRSAMEAMATAVAKEIQLDPQVWNDKENAEHRLQTHMQHNSADQNIVGRDAHISDAAGIIKRCMALRGFSCKERKRAALDLVELKNSDFALNVPTMKAHQGFEFTDTEEEAQEVLNTAKAEAWDASFSLKATSGFFGVSVGVSAEGAKGNRKAKSTKKSSSTLKIESHAVFRGTYPQASYSIGMEQLKLTQEALKLLNAMLSLHDAEDFTKAHKFGQTVSLQGELGGIFYSKSSITTDSEKSVEEMQTTHSEYMNRKAGLDISGFYGSISASAADGEEKAEGEAKRKARMKSINTKTFFVENTGPNIENIKEFSKVLGAEPAKWARLETRGDYHTWDIVLRVSPQHELQVLLLRALDATRDAEWNHYVKAIELLLQISHVDDKEAKQAKLRQVMNNLQKLLRNWDKLEAIIRTDKFLESLRAVEPMTETSTILHKLCAQHYDAIVDLGLRSSLEPFMKQKQVFEGQTLTKTLRTSEDFASEVERAIPMDPDERGQFVTLCYQNYNEYGLAPTNKEVMKQLAEEGFGNPGNARLEPDIVRIVAVVTETSTQMSEKLVTVKMPEMWDEVDLPEAKEKEARRFKDPQHDRLLDCIMHGRPLTRNDIFPNTQDVAQGKGKGRGKGRIASVRDRTPLVHQDDHRHMPPDIKAQVARLILEEATSLQPTIIERIHWQAMPPCLVGRKWFGGDVKTCGFTFTGVGHPEMVTQFPILVTATCKGKDTELHLVLNRMGLVLIDSQNGWGNTLCGHDAWWEFGLGKIKKDVECSLTRDTKLTTVNMRGDVWKTMKEGHAASMKDAFHKYLKAGAVVLIEVGNDEQLAGLDDMGLFKTPEDAVGWFLVWNRTGQPGLVDIGEGNASLLTTREGASASESATEVLGQIGSMYVYEGMDPPPTGDVQDNVWKQHPFTGEQDMPVTKHMQKLLDDMRLPSEERAQLQLQLHFREWGKSKVKSMQRDASEGEVRDARLHMKKSELEQRKILADYVQKYQHRVEKGFHAIPACVEAFVEVIRYCDATGDWRMLQVLERHIKEKAARDQRIANCERRYNEAIKRYWQCVAAGQDEGGSELDDALAKYRSAQNDLENQSLNLDHLQRELGQIYERTEDATFSQRHKLPKLAASMLLNGFSLEIMDGDAEHVRETWMRDTMREVYAGLGKGTTAAVLCAVGKQSSGKTTTLKWLLGISGRTALGRTTKGLHLYLVKNTDKRIAGYDYLLVLDTRGIFPPDLPDDQSRTEQDNRLVTFAMLMADICLLTVTAEESQGLGGTLGIVMKTYYEIHQSNIFQNSSAPELLVVVKGIPPGTAESALGGHYVQFNAALDDAVKQIESDHRASSGQSVKLSRSDLLKFHGVNDVIHVPMLWAITTDTASSRLAREYSEQITKLLDRFYEKLSKRCPRHSKDVFRLFGKMPDDDALANETLWSLIMGRNIARFKDLLEANREMTGNGIVISWRQWLLEQREVIAQECEHSMRESERNSETPRLNDLLSDVRGKLHEKHEEACREAMKQIKADLGLSDTGMWRTRAKEHLDSMLKSCDEAMRIEVQSIYKALFELAAKRNEMHADIAGKIDSAIHNANQRKQKPREAFETWWCNTLRGYENTEGSMSKEHAEKNAEQAYLGQMNRANLDANVQARHDILQRHIPVQLGSGEPIDISQSLRHHIRYVPNPQWTRRTDRGGLISRGWAKLEEWWSPSAYPVITVKALLDDDLLPSVRDKIKSMQRTSGREHASWAKLVFADVEERLNKLPFLDEIKCRSVIHLEVMDEVIKRVGEEENRWIEANSSVSILRRDHETFWLTWKSKWNGTKAATTVAQMILLKLKNNMTLLAESFLTTRASRAMTGDRRFVASDVADLVAWRVIQRIPQFKERWKQGKKEEAKQIWKAMTDTQAVQKEAISEFLQETHLRPREREDAVRKLIQELLTAASRGAGHEWIDVGRPEALRQYVLNIIAVNIELLASELVVTSCGLEVAKTDVQKYLVKHLEDLDNDKAYHKAIMDKMDTSRLVNGLVKRMQDTKEWPCPHVCPLCLAPCMKQWHGDHAWDKHETYHQPFGLTGICTVCEEGEEHDHPAWRDCLRAKEDKRRVRMPKFNCGEWFEMTKFEEMFKTWSLKEKHEHPDLHLRRWMFGQDEVQDFLVWDTGCWRRAPGSGGSAYDLHTLKDIFTKKLEDLYKTHRATGLFRKDNPVPATLVLLAEATTREEESAAEPEEVEVESCEEEPEEPCRETGAEKREEPATNDSDRDRDSRRNRCDEAHEPRKQHQDAEPRKVWPVQQGDATENVKELELVPMPGDGSCLFHSVAHGLVLLGCQENAVRHTVADFMEGHPNFELSGTPLTEWVKWDPNSGPSGSTDTDSQMTVSKYAENLRAGNAWGGELEIRLCTYIFDITITVYVKGSSGFEHYRNYEKASDKTSVEHVRLLFSRGNHYDFLKPVGTA